MLVFWWSSLNSSKHKCRNGDHQQGSYFFKYLMQKVNLKVELKAYRTLKRSNESSQSFFSLTQYRRQAMSSESRELQKEILLTLPVPAAWLILNRLLWRRRWAGCFCRTELSSIVACATENPHDVLHACLPNCPGKLASSSSWSHS